MSRYFLIISLFFLSSFLFGQDGPGGIGTTTGSGNLKLWLKGDSVSIDTGIDTLFDLSGYDNHFVQTNTSYQPAASTLNDFGVMDFDGSGDFLTNTGVKTQINGQSAFTMFFVIKSDATSSDSGFFTTSRPNLSESPFSIRYDKTGDNGSASNIITASTGASGLIESSASIQTTDEQIITFTWVTNTEPDLYIDGLLNTPTYNPPVTGSISGADTVFLGKGTKDDETTEGWDGTIAELVYFNRQLNSAERIIIENYLAAQYNLTIDNDNFTNPAAFKYNPIGIGRSSEGKHTGSVSEGFGVYEDNSSLSVNEYVFAAHNNATNNVASIQIGTNVTNNSVTEAAWARDWYLEKNGDVDVRLFFDFSDGFENGGVPQNVTNYRLLYKADFGDDYDTVETTSQGIQSGDQVFFEVDNAHLADGYYTLGTKDQTNSPVQGSNSKTWYTLVGGDWDDYQIWTLDPSGALPFNPDHEYPEQYDKVVILSGRTVNITGNNIETQKITVEGRLDLGTTTGHDFTEIRGSGRIILEGDNFPAGDSTNFITEGQGEGTVVYKGITDSLSIARTFYNMEVEMNDGDTLILAADYAINGYLQIKQGKLQINNNTSTSRTIVVKGNTTVNSGAYIITGTGDAIHTIEFQGDVTNNGTIQFSNGSQYACPSNGAVRVEFTGAQNNTLLCNGTTNLFRLIVDKGTNQTYILSVLSTNSTYFKLYGPIDGSGCYETGEEGWERLAMVILHGTLKLGSNINIPRLTDDPSGTGPNEFSIPSTARLWINGASVSTHTTGGNNRGLTLIGKLQVSAGSFRTPSNSSGITYDGSSSSPATISISGGTIYTGLLTGDDADSRIAYVQSGGVFNIDSLSNNLTGSAIFDLSHTDHTFEMSGGTILIEAVNTYDTNGVYILCSEGNYNVTGGTIEISLPTLGAAAGGDFELFSDMPLYNFTLSASSVGTQDIEMLNEITVLNDLTIGANTELITNGHDLSIGGDFTLEDDGTYTHGNNNTIFIGGQDSKIIIESTGSAAPLQFYDFEIEKDLQVIPTQFWDVEVQSPDITTSTVPLRINNNFIITRGSFSTDSFEVEMYGDTLEIVDGTITNSADGKITLTGSSTQHTMKSAYAATNQSFGHIDLNNTNGVILLSNCEVTAVTLTAAATLFDLDVYNLEVTDTVYGWSSTKYFVTADNGSDGGLTLHFTVSGSSTSEVIFVTFPVGTSSGYSPAEIYLDDFNLGSSISGSIQVTPVNSRHPGAPVGQSIAYYWVSNETGFSGIPDNQAIYKFYMPGGMTKSGDDRDVALIDNDWRQSNYANSTALLQFRYTNYGFVDGEFTSGNTGQFNNRRILYSRNVDHDVFNDRNSWSETGHDGARTNSAPGATDICILGNGHDMNAFNGNVNVAKLIFSHDTASGPNTIEDLPRLRIDGSNGNYTFNFGKVEGNGVFCVYLRNNHTQTITGDFGDFANEPYSWYLYNGATNGVDFDVPSGEIDIYPNLAIEIWNTASHSFTFPQNVYVNYDFMATGNAILLLDDDADGDFYIDGNAYIGNYYQGQIQFPTSGTERTLTIMGNIDFTLETATTADDGRTITVNNTSQNSLEHNLIVGGSIIQGAGIIDLYNGTGTNNNAILKLYGQEDATFSRSGSENTDLYRIEMFKSPGKSFTFQNTFNLYGPTDSYPKALELLSGDFIIDAGGVDIELSGGGPDFRIPYTTSLEINGASGNPSSIYLGGDETGIYLDGLLTLGDYSEGNFFGNDNNYIEYSSSGYAQIDIYNAELYVGSQIRRPLTTDQGILTFRQLDANSTVELAVNDAPVNYRGVLEIVNEGVFTQANNANITIVQGPEDASVAALLMEPSSVTLGTGSSFTLGSTSTTSATEIGINSTEALPNIIINDADVTAVMMVRALEIEGALTINSGTFDAGGLDLSIQGDFINSGTFTANENTTTFNGSSTQEISGTTTFYNLTKSTSDTLRLNSSVTVENDLNIGAGVLDDNGYTINLEGDLINDGKHIYGGGAGFGITMNGTEEQNISGTGTIAYLTIANADDQVTVKTGNNINISGAINMNGGIFDVGQNLVVLSKDAEIIAGDAFNNTNMIRTNASFTDNGVRKYFDTTTIGYNYIIPIGSGTKYTPITYNVDYNNNSTGYITSKSADEYHPSIIEDDEDPAIVDSLNVLWYHWVLKSSGISNFAATVWMEYEPEDIYVQSPYTVEDYITARILNDGSGLWLKFSYDDFDEANERMNFYFDTISSTEIAGDYTGGVNYAIPDTVPLYETNKNGNWTDGTIWTPNVNGGPRGARVKINLGDTVTIPSNYISSYTTTIYGVLEVNKTFGHRLGTVNGTGTLYIQRPSLPAGDYEDFFSVTGGTLEYGGDDDYDILATSYEVNSLTLSGTGERRFPNQNVVMLGNFKINGDDNTLEVINDHNKNITVKKNITFNLGVFDAGSTINAKFIFGGTTPQTINGNFKGSTRDFYNLAMSNPAGVNVNDNIDISGNLEFTSGVITISDTITLTSITGTVTGNASENYVDGLFRKNLSQGSTFTFPVGDNDRYAPTIITNTQPSGTDYWEIQYFDANPHPAYDTSSHEVTLEMISGWEYWRITGPSSGTSTLQIRWDDQSLLPAMTDDRSANLNMVEWNSTQWEIVSPVTISDGGVNSGTITSDNNLTLNGEHVFTLGTSEGTPLPTAGFITTDTIICGSQQVTFYIELTGSQPWSVTVDTGAVSDAEFTGITSSPFSFNVNLSSTDTFTITGVDDATTPGYITATIYGDPVIVTVATVASTPTPGSDSNCGPGEIELTVTGRGAGEDYNWYDSEFDGALLFSNINSYTNYFTTTTSYWLSIYNSEGCESDRIEIIATIDTLPLPNPVTDNSSICFGDSAELSALTGLNSYNWALTNWGVSGDLTNATSDTAKFKPSVNPSVISQTVTFTVTVTDDNCSNSDNVTIDILRRPVTGDQYYIPPDYNP